jgi:twitching motility two-component system response regulator PilH
MPLGTAIADSDLYFCLHGERGLGMKTVLIAEDEEELADLLSGFLRDSGYRVVCATNGRQALTAMDAVRPDLVLCDILMPELDGLSFCRRLADHPLHSAVPVVLMTALPEHLNLTEYPHAALIRKPFDIDRLLLTIARLTD